MKKGYTLSIIILGSIGILILLAYGVIPLLTKDYYKVTLKDKLVGAVSVTAEVPAVTHIQTPKSVKGIYMSACVAGSKNLREGLVQIADTTEINAIVIDVKDFSGMLSFKPDNEALHSYVSDKCGAKDMQDFLKYLHSKNIYTIARVTVFQDPYYTKLHPEVAVQRKSDGGVWKDKKGISYIDPGSKQAWDHIISIAKASYDIGFDEINFDYIRFPSDGNMKDISFPFSEGRTKPVVIESFFAYLHEKMSEAKIPTSGDLFGMTTTNTDDLGIGQVLERALPYFDYVMPMVYPSHYPKDFNGWKNPNSVPYELIYYVMGRGVERAEATTTPIETFGSERIGTSTPAVYTKPVWDKNKLRTWIQDFDYGGDYGPKEVRAQIKASEDLGLTSWVIWSPSNKYTIDALNK